MFGETFWYMAPILMAITTFLTGAVVGLFKVAKPVWKQVISWIIGSGLSVGAYFLGLVQIGTPIWLGIVVLCIVVGLSSNGIFDIPAIRNFIEKLFKYKQTSSK